MHGYLPYEITKSVETVISDPELAKKVIEAIEKGLYSIEEKAKEQKVIIKTELKDELTKELVTKDELKATEERLRKEMEEIRGEIKATEGKLRGEIKATEEKLRGEIKAIEGKVRGEIKATEEKLRTEIHKWRADTIKWMFIFWLGQIATFTGILVSVLKLMLK
ncbi:hypothetical protein JCM12298_30780 [Desulfothermus naphthae]